jgi:hypothetical protein
VEGAGRGVRQNAADVSAALDEGQRLGMTTDETREVLGKMDELAQARANAAPEARSIFDDVARKYADVKAGGNAEKAGHIFEGYSARASRLAQQEEILDAATRKLTASGNDVFRKMDDTIAEAAFLEKSQQFEKLVDPAKGSEAIDAAIRFRNRANETIRFWEDTASKGGAEGAVKRARKWMTDLDGDLSRIAHNDDGAAAKAFNRLDEFKRQLAPAAQFGKPVFGLPEAARDFDALYHDLRGVLEDEAVFGKAGAAQRDLNAAFSNAKPARDYFENALATRGLEQRMGRPMMVVDPAKGFLGRIGGAEADLQEQSARDFIAGMRNRANKVEEHLSLTGEQKRSIAEGRKSLDTFEKTLNETKDQAAIVARLKKAQAEEQGKAIGGMLGFVSDVISRPYKTMERLADAKVTIDRITKSIQETADRFVEGKASKAPSGVLDKESRREATSLIAEIRRLAGSPTALVAKAHSIADDLPTFAPRHASAVASQLARVVTYLASKAPQGYTPRGALVPPNAAPRYSDADLSKFLRTADAAMKPEEALRKGSLTRDEVECIKFVSPGMYQELRDRTMEQIAKMERDGKLKAMPYDQKLQIATLLGVPADGTLDPAFVQAVQATKQTPAQADAAEQAPAPRTFSGRPMKGDVMTDGMQLEGDRLAAGGTL